MSSMLIVHPDGQADSIRIEPEEFLLYAEYCTAIANQLWRSHRKWEEDRMKLPTKKDALTQMDFEELSLG